MTKRIKLIFSIVAISALFIACGKDGEKKDAKSSEPNPVLAVTAPAGALSVDNVHSMIIFKIKHMGAGYVYGRFNGIGGYVDINDKEPGKSSMVIKIDVNTVDTNVQKRDDHLRSPDFFDAKKFPAAVFTSRTIAASGKDSYKVTGDFEIHGMKKVITADVSRVGQVDKDPMGFTRAGGEARLKIKRSDFGITGIDAKAKGLLGDEVELFIAIEGVKK